MYSKVKDYPGYARDDNSGAIINLNDSEISAARKRKALWRQQNDDINNLKSEVSDIKNMLTKIIEKLDG